MSPQEIENKVKEIICKELEVSPEKVLPETSFTDDLKADSIAVVELVIKFEEEFGITIPEEDTEQMKTVGDALGVPLTMARPTSRRKVRMKLKTGPAATVAARAHSGAPAIVCRRSSAEKPDTSP